MFNRLLTSCLPLILLALIAGTPAPSAPPTPSTPVTQPALQPTQHWIGVAVENIPPTIGRLMKLDPGQGLLIVKVLPDSPAEKADLHPGDLLITIDNKPLTSQLQLAAAANAVESKASLIRVRSSTLGYIRDGDRLATTVTPAPRPPEMLVTGNQNGFTVPVTPDSNKTLASNVYAAGDHSLIEVGPGIVVDLNPAGGATAGVQAIRQYVANGQTVILSQASDSLGRIRNSITAGSKTYPFDSSSIETLPPELRELARSALTPPNTSRPATTNPRRLTPSTTPASLEQRMRALEQDNKYLRQSNQDLSQRLDKLIQLLENQQQPTPPKP